MLKDHKVDQTWVAIISKETTCVVVSSRICSAIKDEVVEATSKASNSPKEVLEACNKICLEATVEAMVTMEWCSNKITLWARVDRTSRATSKIVLTIIKLWSVNFTKEAETVLMVPDALSPMEVRSCNNAASNNLIRMEENKNEIQDLRTRLGCSQKRWSYLSLSFQWPFTQCIPRRENCYAYCVGKSQHIILSQPKNVWKSMPIAKRCKCFVHALVL